MFAERARTDIITLFLTSLLLKVKVIIIYDIFKLIRSHTTHMSKVIRPQFTYKEINEH